MLHLFEHSSCDVSNITKTCKSKLLEKVKEKWKSQLFNDKVHVNGNKMIYKQRLMLNFSFGEITVTFFSMFTCGNLPLHIETGRFAEPKIPIDQRTCFHCTDSVENETYFLIECPFYDDIRRKLLHKAQLCNSDFDMYTSTDKLIFLMNHMNLQPVVASTLFDMFKRRKRVI